MLKDFLKKRKGCVKKDGFYYDPKTDTCRRIRGKTIVINVYRGVVDSVDNIPRGWRYKINDFD